MLEKILLVVIDGLGDRPLSQLEGQTPLEAAEKPNLNKLARRGITGLMNTVGVGIVPGSDIAHFALLGFDPEKYYFGRGPLEALGINFPLKKGEIALRANFATLGEKGIVVDRRAKRFNSKEACALLDGLKIQEVKVAVKHITDHKAVVVLQGKGLSEKVSKSDPMFDSLEMAKIISLDNSKEAKLTASVLNEFSKKAAELLSKSEKAKKSRANCILLRGSGTLHEVQSFESKFGLKACCVAGGSLYKGVARVLGMTVFENPLFTGHSNTDLNLKFETAINCLKDFDFVFLHVKAADSFGEDGNSLEKKEFIERIDKACRSLPELQNAVIAVTADHSTPCVLKAHSGDPVPLLVFGPNIRIDPVTNFSERSCAHGAIGRIKGLELIPELLNLAARAKKQGA